MVNNVFEFGIKPRELSLRRLKQEQALKATPLLEALVTIGAIAKDLRSERNRRAHEGIQRPFGEDSHDTLMFKVAAMSEGERSGAVKDFDLKQEYAKQVAQFYDAYVKDAEALRDAVWQLQALLVDPFWGRLERKKV